MYLSVGISINRFHFPFIYIFSSHIVEKNRSLRTDKANLTLTSANGMGVGGLPDDSVVRILVECGAEVNSRDIYDQTPLHFAAMRGNDPSARDLLNCPQVDIEVRIG